MLQGRLFSYPDTHRHRLGGNYDQIPINCPYRVKLVNGIRDGAMVVNGNQGSAPNYEPSSFRPVRYTHRSVQSSLPVRGLIARYKPAHPNCDFAQPGSLYRNIFTAQQKTNAVENIVGAMQGVDVDILERQIKIFYKCDPEFGTRIAQGVNIPVQRMKL